MQEGMKNYGAVDHKGVDVTWDLVQRGFDCCGVASWEEWKTVNTTGLPGGQVPESCCLKEEKLTWTFQLYDLDGDGVISREEMEDLAMAVSCLY